MTEPDSAVTIFLLEEQELVRRGIACVLEEVPDFHVVGEAATAADALPRVLECRPDVAILDARLPDGSGIDVCRAIRTTRPQTHCLILTSFDDEEARLAALTAGASGYLLKRVDTRGLVDAIRQVARGYSLVDPAALTRAITAMRAAPPPTEDGVRLTRREREVLELITDGLTNRQIGERLFLSETSIKNYVSAVLHKLSLERRTQAAVFGAELRHARRRGLPTGSALQAAHASAAQVTGGAASTPPPG